jgi:ATP-dependent protease ClpP protease subunit
MDQAWKDIPAELQDAIVRKAVAEADVAEKLAKDTQSSNDANRHMHISGVIADMDAEISTLQRWSRRDPGQPITITMNTPGGVVSDGNALLGELRRLQRDGHELTIIGSGVVMSMGASILQVADHRLMERDCVFMIHGINAPNLGGGIEQVLDLTKMMKDVEDKLLTELAAKSNLTKTKLKAMIKRKDLFLNAEDTLKYGLIDEIV